MKNKIVAIIFLMLISVNIFADNLRQYNIFLIPDKGTKTYINNFNNLANKNGLYKKYEITPFSKNHPIHLSLYITSFKRQYLGSVIDLVKDIANSTEQFAITTNQITVGKSGFVMLDINNSHNLQGLSNTVITYLNKYRNKNLPIPFWVKYYPEKQESFEKYGTPNAFKQFDPHFSILSKELNTDKIKQIFVDDFDKTIKEFNPIPKNFKIIGIGFGEVDNNGQVTEIIKQYSFKNK